MDSIKEMVTVEKRAEKQGGLELLELGEKTIYFWKIKE